MSTTKAELITENALLRKRVALLERARRRETPGSEQSQRLRIELTEALEQQTATSEILRVISQSTTDTRPVFDTIVRNARRLCAADSCSVFTYGDETIHLESIDNATVEGADAIRRAYPLPPNRGHASGRAILTGRPVHIPDVRDDPEYDLHGILGAGLRSILAVPMLRAGLAIGTITLHTWATPRPFTDAQIELLKIFADQAVIAIENVRLFTELQAKNQALTEAHAQVTEALEQQTATSEILRVISSSPTDVQPVFVTIVRNAVRLCDGLFSALFRYDGELIHQVAQHNFSPEALEQLHRTYPTRPTRALGSGRAILERAVAHIPDVELDPEYQHLTLSRVIGHRSSLSVPMLREGAPIGVIWVARAEPRPFSDNEIELLKTFADQAVIAIENVRLFTELQASNRELTTALDTQTATSDILRVISQSQTDVQPVFDAIVRNAVRLCGALQGGVYRFDGELVHSVAHDGYTPEQLQQWRATWPKPVTAPSFACQAIKTRSPVRIRDFETAPELALHSPETVANLRARGSRSVLAVPMFRQNEVIGAISLAHREVDTFSDAHLELLKTFADQAVIAVENVRLFKELEARTAELTRSVGELTALGEISQVLSSTLDLETVLTTIVSRAVQLSGLDGGVVFEYDDSTEEFVHRAATETGGTLAEARRTTRVRRGEGVVGQTAITLEPAQMPDIAMPGAYGLRLRENLLESGIRAILAVPMARDDQLIGCLVVSRNRPGEFPPETIELLRTFATQSALAIQNARLYRELEQKSCELQAAS